MRRAVAAAVVLVGALHCAIARGELKIMPEELLEAAKRNGCAQLTEFYENKPGSLDPVYAYGYLPGDKEESAVFWCKTLAPNALPYSLVFLFKKVGHELTKCPDKINWRNPPRGLSIYYEPKATLKEFRYLSDPKRKVPEGVRLKNNAVRSYYDGVEELFYCHEGEWLVRQAH